MLSIENTARSVCGAVVLGDANLYLGVLIGTKRQIQMRRLCKAKASYEDLLVSGVVHALTVNVCAHIHLSACIEPETTVGSESS